MAHLARRIYLGYRSRMRRLTLKRESLAELTSDEIRGVVGAQATLGGVNSCLTDCMKLSCGCTGDCYESLNSCYVTCTCIPTQESCTPTIG